MRPLWSIIVEALPEAEIINQSLLPECASFSVDSRTVQPGEVFVALRGQSSDGHDFLEEACARGACALMIEKIHRLKLSQSQIFSRIAVILVENTTHGLNVLGHAWRKQFSYPVVGITGSAGKTSLRKTIENILTTAHIPFVSSLRNQNSLSGVPLTLLRMRDSHTVALVEMGISKRGEMAQLAAMAEPTAAVISLIGHAHMEGLGGFAEIAHEKKQIFSRFKSDNIGIVNGDQPILAQSAYPHPVIKFGTKTTNQVQARKIRANFDGSSLTFTLKLYGKKQTIQLPTSHKGAVFNALAAAAVGHLLQIPVDAIIAGITMPVDVPGRFERIKISERTTIINDCYNASPESVKESLMAFERLQSMYPKVAVLGEMRELGANSAFWHRQIGRFLRKIPSVKRVVLVGPMTQWIRKTIPLSVEVAWASDWSEAVQYVAPHVATGMLMFVKGSRGLTLEKLIAAVSTPSPASITIQPAIQTTA